MLASGNEIWYVLNRCTAIEESCYVCVYYLILFPISCWHCEQNQSGGHFVRDGQTSLLRIGPGQGRVLGFRSDSHEKTLNKGVCSPQIFILCSGTINRFSPVLYHIDICSHFRRKLIHCY